MVSITVHAQKGDEIKGSVEIEWNSKYATYFEAIVNTKNGDKYEISLIEQKENDASTDKDFRSGYFNIYCNDKLVEKNISGKIYGLSSEYTYEYFKFYTDSSDGKPWHLSGYIRPAN